MVQKILSDKVMNERTNAYYSYYLGERNISVLPLNVYDPPERFIAYIKKNRENLNITLSDFELEQIAYFHERRSVYSTHLRAHEMASYLGCSLQLENKK